MNNFLSTMLVIAAIAGLLFYIFGLIVLAILIIRAVWREFHG